jgi:thiol-disulfide isomerase/thioredoxin
MTQQSSRAIDAAVGILIVSALTIFGWRWAHTASQASASEQEIVGQTPGVIMVEPPGDTATTALSLASDSGRVVLVFQHGCAPCEDQRGTWEELAREAAGNVVAISMMPQGPEVHRFFRDPAVVEWYPKTVPQVTSVLGVRATPTTLIVDSAGTIAFARIGPMNRRDWLAFRRALR